MLNNISGIRPISYKIHGALKMIMTLLVMQLLIISYIGVDYCSYVDCKNGFGRFLKDNQIS